MRCSDCKYFKTKECKVNPKAENFYSAENFVCFELDANRQTSDREITASPQSAALQMSAKPRGNKTKTAGIIWLCMGFAVLVICPTVCYSLSDTSGPTHYFAIEGAILGMIVGIIFFIIGVILLTLWWNQERKRVERMNETTDKQNSKFKTRL
jgi:uncharacterized membrane protein